MYIYCITFYKRYDRFNNKNYRYKRRFALKNGKGDNINTRT